MQVDMSQLSSYMAYELRQAIAQGNAPSLTEYVPEAAPTDGKSPPDGSAANGGTASSSGAGLLAAKTAQLLMKMYQALPSNQEQDPSAPPPLVPLAEQRFDLAIGMVDSMASCVDDPATANAVVKSLTGPMLVPLRKIDLKHGGFVNNAEDYAKDLATLNGLNPQLQMIYKRNQAEGKSTAQSIDDMLALQLSQPESYWKARDPDNIQGNQKEMVGIELQVLTLALAQSTGEPGHQTATARGADAGHPHTLNLKWKMSPSWTMYSLPSWRILPASLQACSPPSSTKAS